MTDDIPTTESAATIPGDALSCYTAAISRYLQKHRLDPVWIIGSQFYLAVADNAADRPDFEFVHYHTPLLGAGSLAGARLERRSAPDARRAAAAILADFRDSGPVIVSGDTFRLPWQVSCGVRHAPHWFVVDDVAADGNAVHVSDAFAYTDDEGDQAPHAGWHSLDDLASFASISADRSGPLRSREIWALGTAERDDPESPHQWLATIVAPAACRFDAGSVGALFATSLDFATGRVRRADLSGPHWHVGPDALRHLHQRFIEFLAEPALYDFANDLWVAARTRELFARTLARAEREFGFAAAGTLATRLADDIVPLWNTLPQLLRYNLACLERGRKPRQLLADTLGRIADAETVFIRQFAEGLGAKAPLAEVS
ncbi:MAG: hypothetical protein R3D02_10550 [Hyphomicrobiales bacterium]